MIDKRTFRRRATPLPRQTVGLLAELGVDCRLKHNRTIRRYELKPFWTRLEPQLNYILYDAWKQYRERSKLVHPDKGGQADKFRRLHKVWQQVKINFAKHGITLAALVLVGCRTPLQTLDSPLQLAPEQSPWETISLRWNYPLAEMTTNIQFRVWHQTDFTVPFYTVTSNVVHSTITFTRVATNWTVVATVPGTTNETRLPVQPGVHFFVLTARTTQGLTNEVTGEVTFMESDPSNAALLQVPQRGSNVTIRLVP